MLVLIIDIWLAVFATARAKYYILLSAFYYLPLISFDGFIENMMSAFALLSLSSHFRTSSADFAFPEITYGFGFGPLAYSHVSFLVSNACIWIFHVS